MFFGHFIANFRFSENWAKSQNLDTHPHHTEHSSANIADIDLIFFQTHFFKNHYPLKPDFGQKSEIW